jgi:hypothetical protein
MAGRKERLARALESSGLALNDMHDRLAGIETTQGEILSLLRTLHSEFGSHRDHAMETISAQGKRIGEARKDHSDLVRRVRALEGADGAAE